jgi:Protein of unknown function (DUF4232)
MKPTTRAARRGLAALALTCTAAVIPTAALAASGSPAKPAAAARSAAAAVPPRCGTGALTAWLGIPGDGYAGGVVYQLELSNTSTHACTLYGYPGVSALAPGGHQLGHAAGRGPASANRLVTLGRGATAHAVLQITDVANFPPSSCGETTAVALRVYPPGATRSLEIPFTFQACSKSGPVYLHVGTTEGGTGIPGFSR